MDSPAPLVLEVREQPDMTPVLTNGDTAVAMMSPLLNDGYWSYRVAVGNGQAVVGFPKFGTIGIGFAREDIDGNTNLPYGQPAEEIADHIAKNAGHPSITRDITIAAIELIQARARADRAAT